mgnify:FL=1
MSYGLTSRDKENLRNRLHDLANDWAKDPDRTILQVEIEAVYDGDE